jgi:predicted RNase H-like nuclease
VDVRLVGVDGCRAGWVTAAGDLAASRDRLLLPLDFTIMPTFRALVDALRGGPALIAVDIPIGLPDGLPRDDGRRRVDAEARAFLGPRRASSVFSAPCRPTLHAASYREACDLEVRARGGGNGLSQQTYRIIPKIRDVDRVMRPEHQAPLGAGSGVWVREVHPEVVFAVLAGAGQRGHGLIHSKRGCKVCRRGSVVCTGETDRLTLLREYVPDFEPGAVRAQLLREHVRRPGQRGPVVGRDDIVDAVVCLVTALRIVTGHAVTLPEGDPEHDARGLRMEIVA